MRCCLLIAFAVFALLNASAESPCQAPGQKAGLKVGNDLPGPFHAYNINGKRFKGRFHCLVCEHGLNPAVMVIVRGTDQSADHPLRKLLPELDKYVQKYQKDRLAAFAVFLDEGLPDVVTNDEVRDGLAKKLDEAFPALKEVVLSLAGKDDLEKYQLDDTAEVTVVLYNRYKILAVHTFKKDKLSDGDVKSLLEEVVQKLTAKNR